MTRRRLAQRQAGAALLLAMVILTLVSTLAAGMVWQQARAVQVEAAERARAQAAWILTGALDWARLILREDFRNGGADHLGEPWAVPLAEARLSTFLAADRDNVSDDGPEAFLSGTITDAQSRYNLRNLVVDGKIVTSQLRILQRLCLSAGLTDETATRIAQGLSEAQSDAPPERPLAPQTEDQLVWLGVSAAQVESLRNWVVLLPVATPLNLNTAAPEVMAAVVEGLDLGSAQRLVTVRQRNPFSSIDEARAHLPTTPSPDLTTLAVASRFFEVQGRLRLGDRVLEERSLVERRNPSTLSIVALRRERVNLSAGSR